MYKQAFIYSLKSLAKEAPNGVVSAAPAADAAPVKIDNSKPVDRPIEEFKPAPFNAREMFRVEPIELTPKENESSYALQNVMMRGSGKNLRIPAYKTHDLASATNGINLIKFNPGNLPVNMHEYGHAIDKPNALHEYALSMLHPALGSAYKYKQEVDAHDKGFEAFAKGTKHNKELAEEMAKAHGMIRDKALATYRTSLAPRAIGSIGGSVLGGIAGYYTSPQDAGVLNKSLRTIGGAWLGGHFGGTLGSIAAIPGNRRANDDILKTLYSKEYIDSVNSLNKKFVEDARAHNYYRPNIIVRPS